MVSIKHFLISVISIVMVSGTVIMLTPTPNDAKLSNNFGSLFGKDKCDMPPTWGEIIKGKKRWVKKLSGAAYCDRETGLVWEAAPSSDTFVWGILPPNFPPNALRHCLTRTVGDSGRTGWRLPSIVELATLIDRNSSTCVSGMLDSICLPDGHPFQNIQPFFYWSATTISDFPTSAWDLSMFSGFVSDGGKPTPLHAWCVRGPMQESVY